MKFKPKVNGQLFTCGTCGKRYNNPLDHICKIRLDRKAKGGAKGGAKRKGSSKKKK